jgi:meiotically up-regulated gene 157 (Mug157) protein
MLLSLVIVFVLIVMSFVSLDAAIVVPNARPPVSKRRFVSATVEAEIVGVHSLLNASTSSHNAAIAQLFSNAYPNTLDTTVHMLNNMAFIITGDIDAMWLRDSTNSVIQYMPLLKAQSATNLRALIASLIARQAKCVNTDVYANAHYAGTDQVSPWSTDSTSALSFAGTHTPAMRLPLHERKFEIDSLGSFFHLASAYWLATNDLAPFDADFRTALTSAIDVLALHQQLDTEATRGATNAPYLFQRSTVQPSDTLQDGVGAPGRACGLIRSAFRPSDDALLLPYNIPQNAFVAVQLGRVAKLANALGWTEQATAAANLSASVTAAIHKCGVFQHPVLAQPVYAYEVDGFGNAIFMDDANLPSLLSLPYLGFCNSSDPVYRNTRQYLLSNTTNPFFFAGAAGEGIGSPHTGFGRIWPMSVMTRAFTTDDENEIRRCLQVLVASTAGTGLFHESFQRDNPSSFTRPWFAWANGYFGELILRLIERYPNVFK